MLASKSLCSAGSPLPWAGPQRGIDELQMALSLRRPSHQKSPLKQPGNPQNGKRDGVCDARKHLKPACWRTQHLREQHMWILTHYILIPFAKLLSEMSSVLSISILEMYDKKKTKPHFSVAKRRWKQAVKGGLSSQARNVLHVQGVQTVPWEPTKHRMLRQGLFKMGLSGFMTLEPSLRLSTGLPAVRITTESWFTAQY